MTSLQISPKMVSLSGEDASFRGERQVPDEGCANVVWGILIGMFWMLILVFKVSMGQLTYAICLCI